MPATRKRKAAAVEDQQGGKQAKTPKTQKSINAFGSVKKQNTEVLEEKKKVAPLRESAQAPAPATKPKKSEKKRKHEVVEESDDEIVVAPARVSRPQQNEPKAASTPRNKRVKNAVLPTPAETPSRATAALFDRLNISPKSRAIPFPLAQNQPKVDTLPATPPEEKEDIDLSLPNELQDLQNLHASFLTSLSLYYAHNGTSSPVEINAFLPMVTKSWKKRAVKLQDLQCLLSFDQPSGQKFSLQDFGRAGICLTRDVPPQKRAPSYIDEEERNDKFEGQLLQSWRGWQSQVKSNRSAAVFIAQLPLAEIPQNASVAKSAPLFARGQQRLADLKGASAAASKSDSPLSTAKSSPIPPTSTANRGTALLDRILAKQTLASTLPAGPTKEQLERKAALHRVENVSRVLSLLVGARERHSLSLPAIVQQLQQSLRNPISKDEVLKCLNVMSGEITPGFVRVIQSGEVQGVVIVRSCAVGHAELRRRVERALG